MDTAWFRYKGDGSVAPGHKPPEDAEPGFYLAGEDLVIAVNTAITVEQPLLVVGESGTGKTTLAESISTELGLPLLKFHTRSDHKARDILLVVDNLRRFYDATVQDARARQFENYITWQALGSAIRAREQCVVLIDEIDKAPRDFPNDLLREIDRMEFEVPELEQTFRAAVRPIVIVTSNNERQLPEPFLRRCVFHSIAFPDQGSLQRILNERLRHLQVASNLIDVATKRFLALRDEALQLEKKPATGELITWVKVLHRAGIDPARLAATPPRELPFMGTMLKNQSDLDAVRQSPA